MFVGFPTLAQTPYTIQGGDTLEGISRRYQLSLAKLLRANPQIKQPDRIQVGTPLILPIALPSPKVTQTETPLRRALVTLRMPDRGLPSNLVGAAARGCERDYKPALTLLVPPDEMGFTADARPTFTWIAPQLQWKDVPPALLPQLEFKLVSETKPDAPLYRTVISTGGESELIQLTLPSDAPALEVNQRYIWSVTVLCGEVSPMNVTTAAWIQRIDPAIQADRWYDRAPVVQENAYPRTCVIPTQKKTVPCS
jgi:LysM repeat protein